MALDVKGSWKTECVWSPCWTAGIPNKGLLEGLSSLEQCDFLLKQDDEMAEWMVGIGGGFVWVMRVLTPCGFFIFCLCIFFGFVLFCFLSRRFSVQIKLSYSIDYQLWCYM